MSKRILALQQLARKYYSQRALSPADWFNDAILAGVASTLALNEMALVELTRQVALSYAEQTLKLSGVTPSKSDPILFEYPRNSDPWTAMYKPVREYRAQAFKHPELRPTGWGDDTVDGWLSQALDRLDTVIDMDARKAGVNMSVEKYKRSKVSTYRRVIHPEMSKSGTCGLCIVASDRYYSTGHLLPLHNRCKCTVAPLGKKDLGLHLNQQDLQHLYDAAGSTSGRDLKNIRVKEMPHGELGTILTAGEARAGVSSSGEMWKPDASTSRKTLERMRDRSFAFAKYYKQILDTGESVKFKVDGQTFEFHPWKDKTSKSMNVARIQRARRENQKLYQTVQAMLARMDS